MTSVELLNKLCENKTLQEENAILRRKVLMAGIVMLSLEDFYQKHLASKAECEGPSEAEFCSLAGQAKAWLLDAEL